MRHGKVKDYRRSRLRAGQGEGNTQGMRKASGEKGAEKRGMEAMAVAATIMLTVG